MDDAEIYRQSERLVNLLATVHARAKTVYELTEPYLDTVGDDARNPLAESATNSAYDQLLSASRLIEAGRSLLAVGAYPRYNPSPKYWSGLEASSDEQRSRLDHHLRYTCLRDTGDLLSRKEAAEAVINGIVEIHEAHDVMFLLSTTGNLEHDEQRLLDGVVELSLKYVETIAGVLRNLTRIAPSG